jgi:hypothetical protein
MNGFFTIVGVITCGLIAFALLMWVLTNVSDAIDTVKMAAAKNRSAILERDALHRSNQELSADNKRLRDELAAYPTKEDRS